MTRWTAWISGSRARPRRWQRETGLLTPSPGFGDVVAQAWLGEIGPAPHRHFASHEKLASWVTLCPGNNISARKRKHGRTGDAGTYIKPMLVHAAWAAIRVRGRLQARYNRLVRRFGGEKNPAAKKKAITAIAHTLLKIAYQVLKSGTPYTEPGADFYTRRESPQQKQAWLDRQLQKLHPGCTVTITISPRRPPYRPAPDRQPRPRPAPEPPPARPTRRTINAFHRFLAAAWAKVRCRAPTEDPVVVSAVKRRTDTADQDTLQYRRLRRVAIGQRLHILLAPTGSRLRLGRGTPCRAATDLKQYAVRRSRQVYEHGW